MLSIALAVNHLHARRIAHLDMKSPNILLSKDGLAKLADVGLSRLVKQDATALSMPGTFSWASPEQTEGRAGLPADVWAFGTILWEVNIFKALFCSCTGLCIQNLLLYIQGMLEECRLHPLRLNADPVRGWPCFGCATDVEAVDCAGVHL